LRLWASAENFHVADVAVQMDDNKRLHSYTTEKMPHESTRSTGSYFEISF